MTDTAARSTFPETLTGGDHAYAELRSRIMSGQYAPNTVLRAQALAEEFGLSRTPLREALRRLAETGLVQYEPNKGATVIGYTAEQMAETYFVRAALESRAAGLAAPRIVEADIGFLTDRIERMEPLTVASDEVDTVELGRLNSEFHAHIVEVSGSLQLKTLLRSVSQAPMMVRNFRSYGSEFRRRSNHHHRDIVTALQTGDALWAEVAMRSHILAARNAAMQVPSTPTPGD
jgi:DNA-binding GntR family transcriptional regulator